MGLVSVVPFTCRCVAGLLVLIPTPLVARMRKVLLFCDMKSAPKLSARTKVPSWLAIALFHAAKE